VRSKSFADLIEPDPACEAQSRVMVETVAAVPAAFRFFRSATVTNVMKYCPWP